MDNGNFGMTFVPFLRDFILDGFFVDELLMSFKYHHNHQAVIGILKL